MRRRVPLRHLTFLAICVALSLLTKRLISPVTNLLTDFIRIPGGGAAAAFSLMFLAVGTAGIHWRWATTAAGFIQGLLAMALGMSAYQGGYAVVTYTLPGLVTDLVRLVYPCRNTAYFALSCAAANTCGALLTTLLVFRLDGLAFVLWLLVAASMGMLAGLLGAVIFKRISKTAAFRRFVVCQEIGSL